MAREPELPWTAALRDRRFQLLALGSLVGVVAAMLSLNAYLQFNEGRYGTTIPDPVLARLPALDASWPLFALIYGSLTLTVANLARHPRALLIALQAYGLLALVRIVMMFSIPLEPPPGMIMLVDPLVRAFGGGANWSKDLFFSGHTSTTFLCALCIRSRALKLLCLLGSATVAALVLLQHAHYTIDVLVAPFVAYGVVRLAHNFSAWVLDR